MDPVFARTTPHFSPYSTGAGLIFVSGQMALGGDSRIVAGGVREQTLVCLERIAGILRDAGCEVGDIVKATVWLAASEDFVEFNQAYAQFFGVHRPARSTVCSQLMLAEARVEIEVVARAVAPAD